VEIEPSVLLPVGGEDTLAFLSCGACLPSWEINHVPIDQPPRSVVNREATTASSVRGAGKPWLGAPRAGLAAELPKHPMFDLKFLAIAFALAGLGAAVRAAHLWWKSGSVPVLPDTAASISDVSALHIM
jgi:hypothetical protein